MTAATTTTPAVTTGGTILAKPLTLKQLQRKADQLTGKAVRLKEELKLANDELASTKIALKEAKMKEKTAGNGSH